MNHRWPQVHSSCGLCAVAPFLALLLCPDCREKPLSPPAHSTGARSTHRPHAMESGENPEPPRGVLTTGLHLSCRDSQESTGVSGPKSLSLGLTQVLPRRGWNRSVEKNSSSHGPGPTRCGHCASILSSQPPYEVGLSPLCGRGEKLKSEVTQVPKASELLLRDKDK